MVSTTCNSKVVNNANFQISYPDLTDSVQFDL